MHRPKLIERKEPATRAPRIRATARRHRRDDDRAEMFVQFVRGDDHARPRLLDFAAQCRVESNEIL